MISTKKKAPNKAITAPLSDGNYLVSIHTITEHGGQLAVKFSNKQGYYWMYHNLTPTAELYKFLGELAHIGGLDETRTHSVNDLIGLEYQIVISNQQLKEINKP